VSCPGADAAPAATPGRSAPAPRAAHRSVGVRRSGQGDS